jgi:hypothetical protein
LSISPRGNNCNIASCFAQSDGAKLIPVAGSVSQHWLAGLAQSAIETALLFPVASSSAEPALHAGRSENNRELTAPSTNYGTFVSPWPAGIALMRRGEEHRRQAFALAGPFPASALLAYAHRVFLTARGFQYRSDSNQSLRAVGPSQPLAIFWSDKIPRPIRSHIRPSFCPMGLADQAFLLSHCLCPCCSPPAVCWTSITMQLGSDHIPFYF